MYYFRVQPLVLVLWKSIWVEILSVVVGAGKALATRQRPGDDRPLCPISLPLSFTKKASASAHRKRN